MQPRKEDGGGLPTKLFHLAVMLLMIPAFACGEDDDSPRKDSTTIPDGSPTEGTSTFPDQGTDGLELDSIQQFQDIYPMGDGYPMGLRQITPGARSPGKRFALRPGSGSLYFDFRWVDLPGRPFSVDLELESAGQPLFQVFSPRGRPFARAGLNVVSLQPSQDYRLVIENAGEGNGVLLRLLHLSTRNEALREMVPDADVMNMALGPRRDLMKRVQVHPRLAKMASAPASHIAAAILP